MTNRNNSYKALLDRLWTNEDFKNCFIAGEDVPEDLTICFYEDTLNVRHLVIPMNPSNEQLSDSQLEMVAGGIASPILSQPQPYIIGLIALDNSQISGD